MESGLGVAGFEGISTVSRVRCVAVGVAEGLKIKHEVGIKRKFAYRFLGGSGEFAPCRESSEDDIHGSVKAKRCPSRILL